MTPVFFHPVSGRAFNHKVLHEALGNSSTSSVIINRPTHMVCEGCVPAMQYVCGGAVWNVDGTVYRAPSSGEFWIHNSWFCVSADVNQG